MQMRDGLRGARSRPREESNMDMLRLIDAVTVGNAPEATIPGPDGPHARLLAGSQAPIRRR